MYFYFEILFWNCCHCLVSTFTYLLLFNLINVIPIIIISFPVSFLIAYNITCFINIIYIRRDRFWWVQAKYIVLLDFPSTFMALTLHPFGTLTWPAPALNCACSVCCAPPILSPNMVNPPRLKLAGLHSNQATECEEVISLICKTTNMKHH